MSETVALCLGGARSVWEDLAAAKALLARRRHIPDDAIDIARVLAGRINTGREVAVGTLRPAKRN